MSDQAALPILKLGDPRLRKVCEVVRSAEAARPVIDALWRTSDYVSTLHNFTRGRGIAAPQLGFLVRIFVAEFDGVRRNFINPEIIERSKTIEPIREGCLSFFDYRGFVPRANWVKVRALSEKFEPFEVEGAGNTASLLQHEIDHLDGILYFDRLPNREEDLILMDGMPVIP